MKIKAQANTSQPVRRKVIEGTCSRRRRTLPSGQKPAKKPVPHTWHNWLLEDGLF